MKNRGKGVYMMHLLDDVDRMHVNINKIVVINSSGPMLSKSFFSPINHVQCTATIIYPASSNYCFGAQPCMLLH